MRHSRTSMLVFGGAVLVCLSIVCKAQDTPAPAKNSTPAEQPAEAVGQKAPSGNDEDQIIITADEMVLEMKESPNVVTFQSNVVVTDPQLVLRCAKLVATFDTKTQKILRAEATGGVTITQSNRVGKAEKASYTPQDGKIVLEGAPRLESPEGVVEGKVITYFRDSEKVVVSGGIRMEIKPEGKKSVTDKP